MSTSDPTHAHHPAAAPPARGRPIRVLQVVHRYLPELGGTENHVAEVTRRLAAVDGVDVTVLTTDRNGTLPPRDLVNGVPVIRRAAWPRNRDYYLAPGVTREIRRGGWDVVHVQGVHTAVPPLAMLAALRARTPFVLTFHSGGHSSSGRTAVRGAQFRALTPVLRRADRLIAVSRFERDRFSRITGLPADRFTVIGNGGALPAVDRTISPVAGRIISTGRLERYKGHHLAIQALPRIRRSIPEAHLVVLGGGPYEPELRALVDRLQLQDAVRIGHLPPDDRQAMAVELGRACVMAALSSYEAHPVGVMEAVASGLPVIGSDVAGIGDLVRDGLVTGVPAGATVTGIADALTAALRAPDRSSDSSLRRRQDVELPTWESCTRSLVEVYRDVAGVASAAGSGSVANPRRTVVRDAA